MTIRRRLLFASMLAWASVAYASPFIGFVQSQEEAAPPPSAVTTLNLSASSAAELQRAMDAHDYLTAEKILLAEINRDPRSAAAGRMLAYIGTVYFLHQDYLNAAIAWKKSDAIAPLPPDLRFSLAMTYIRISHPDWARPLLASLAQQDGANALYPYWLGRLDYDVRRYKEAILHFQHAIELKPTMARAYDNLGLCYFYDDNNQLAIENYKKAIELDRTAQHPSPWPYLNLAVTQQFLGQLSQAEANLHEALRLDPSLAPAHFQLGSVFEDSGRLKQAVVELQQAARLNPDDPQPHVVLARIYHRMGQGQAAQDEAQIYQRLRPANSKP